MFFVNTWIPFRIFGLKQPIILLLFLNKLRSNIESLYDVFYDHHQQIWANINVCVLIFR